MRIYFLSTSAGLAGKFARIAAAIAICIAAFFSTARAQNGVQEERLNKVLQSYYAVKDALINGDSEAASAGATQFLKNLNGVSYQNISEGNVSALLKSAGAIADAKDINAQRSIFAGFSSNMAEVAKALKMSTRPVYIQYCPMKKTVWLSSESEIKNPYYGSAMLGCGEVKETIE